MIQFAAATDVVANLDRIGRLVREAARQGADLVVVPEAAMHDFATPDRPLGPIAQDIGGAFVSALTELAREVEATIVAGMFERSADLMRPFNTLVALGPGGELLATYRKAHLYDSFGYCESNRLLAGDGASVTFEAGGFTLGLMTCYDLRFPEFARGLVSAGADVLVVPAAWVRGPLKEDHWVTLLRARAIENTAYVVAAAQTGSTYAGRSMIVDPMGVALSALGDEEGSTSALLTAGRLTDVRMLNPSLDNRRSG